MALDFPQRFQNRFILDPSRLNLFMNHCFPELSVLDLLLILFGLRVADGN
jgi:hypothetical protein